MNTSDVWDRIEILDKIPEPNGWIQWKVTEVCMDLYCECGQSSHFDGDFFCFFECPHCNRKYSVGCYVKLHKLTDEESELFNDRMKLADP